MSDSPSSARSCCALALWSRDRRSRTAVSSALGITSFPAAVPSLRPSLMELINPGHELPIAGGWAGSLHIPGTASLRGLPNACHRPPRWNRYENGDGLIQDFFTIRIAAQWLYLGWVAIQEGESELNPTHIIGMELHLPTQHIPLSIFQPQGLCTCYSLFVQCASLPSLTC